VPICIKVGSPIFKISEKRTDERTDDQTDRRRSEQRENITRCLTVWHGGEIKWILKPINKMKEWRSGVKSAWLNIKNKK